MSQFSLEYPSLATAKQQVSVLCTVSPLEVDEDIWRSEP